MDAFSPSKRGPLMTLIMFFIIASIISNVPFDEDLQCEACKQYRSLHLLVGRFWTRLRCCMYHSSSSPCSPKVTTVKQSCFDQSTCFTCNCCGGLAASRGRKSNDVLGMEAQVHGITVHRAAKTQLGGFSCSWCEGELVETCRMPKSTWTADERTKQTVLFSLSGVENHSGVVSGDFHGQSPQA